MSTESKIRAYGLRATETRTKILDLISSYEHAISKKVLEENLDNIDRVTLYRTMISFEEKGLVHKIVDGDGNVKYAACKDSCTSHHHNDEHVHFHCEKCNNTFCLEQAIMPEFKIPEGYKLSEMQIVAKGICEKCNHL